MNQGPRHLSETIPAIAGQVFGRKYIMLGRLVTHWPEIVGADLATEVQPVGIKYSNSRKKADSAEDKSENSKEFTLEIAADNASATVLRYRIDLILERINQIFGGKWITAIRFVPKSTNTQQNKRYARPPKPLTFEQKQSLSDMLKDVQDPETAELLKKLGTAILQDRKS
jgi:hypothetical protein